MKLEVELIVYCIIVRFMLYFSFVSESGSLAFLLTLLRVRILVLSQGRKKNMRRAEHAKCDGFVCT